MSILIKGMEMPKSCDKCELMTANYGCAFVGAVGGESYSKRAWDCPLVEVPEQMKWIPVTERLPEENGDYLVHISCKRGKWIELCTYDGKDWQSLEGWYEISTDVVTHWMPLPQPPEDGET